MEELLAGDFFNTLAICGNVLLFTINLAHKKSQLVFEALLFDCRISRKMYLTVFSGSPKGPNHDRTEYPSARLLDEEGLGFCILLPPIFLFLA